MTRVEPDDAGTAVAGLSAPVSNALSHEPRACCPPRLAHGVGTRRCVSRGARVRQPGSSSPRAPQRESAVCHGRTSRTKIMLAQWPNRFFTRAQIIVGRGFAPVRSRSRVPAVWGQQSICRSHLAARASRADATDHTRGAPLPKRLQCSWPGRN